MEDNPLLLVNTLAMAVARMRELQRLITPGAPMGLRKMVQEAEAEVDALVALHLTPSALQPEVQT